MKKDILAFFIVFVALFMVNKDVKAQNLPAFTYPTPQVYTVGTPIAPLSPSSSGGILFPSNYNAPATFTSYATPFSIAIDKADNVYTTNNGTGDLTKYNATGTALFTINTGYNQASEVAVDGAGNIYISQFTANSVMKYNSSGVLIATIPGFSDPYGIAFDAADNAYIANYLSGTISKIAAGTTTASVYLTGFTKPYGLIIDNAGNMFVGEQGPGDIIKVAAGSLSRTTIATGFNGPRHLSKDNSGNIFVADYGNNAIKKISATGTVSSILATGLNSPRQAAFNSSGNMFIANFGTNTLLKSFPARYSINAPLPAGLNFDTTTGQITGTPTAPAVSTNYTITANYNGVVTSTPLNITVGALNQAQPVTPLLSTLVPSAIQATGATLNGLINITGANTSASFIYGTDPTLKTGTTQVNLSNGNINLQTNGANFSLASLQPSTTYYYQIAVTKAGVTTPGNIISFTTLPSSNAGLSSLSTNAGSISPVFNAATLNYTDTVANSISLISIKPLAIDSTATITVNGTAVKSGSNSIPVLLNVGSINTITVDIISQDGMSKQTYTVVVTRQSPVISTNASLEALIPGSGSLSPAFNSATLSYTDTVSTAVSSITIKPVTADSTSTVVVNGSLVSKGGTSLPVALKPGNTSINTVVTAQDGVTTQTYTLIVNQQLSSNSGLASLTPTVGKLSPVFNTNTLSYTDTVANGTTMIAFKPVVLDTTSVITVNGTPVSSGNNSIPVLLNVGSNNTITTTVTAQDGITRESYLTQVTRLPSSNAMLASLSPGSGKLSPAFNSSVLSYTDTVANSINTISLLPVLADSTANITINGLPAASGSNSSPIQLLVGANNITAAVTAQDGLTKQNYTVTVVRQQSSNALLASLNISSGSLSPQFNGTTLYYTDTVANSINSVTVKPVVSDSTATVKVNGIAVSNVGNAATVSLAVGNNNITTVVTAQDGVTSQNYVITIFRKPSSNAALASLTPDNGILSPNFDPATISYTDTVANSVTALSLKPVTSDSTAVISINGVPVLSGSNTTPIALVPGNNTITTVVTAQDGITRQNYTVTVNRKPSSNASLASLTANSGNVLPAFNPSVVNYSDTVANSVTSISVKPLAADSTATITLNGIVVASGTASSPVNLSVGNNTIVTKVTAQDGITTQSYKLTVNRLPSANASLAALTPGSGSLSPVFSLSIFNYVDTVLNNVTSITLKPLAADSNAIITVNGSAVANGSTSSGILLTVGNNKITTTINAQDGITIQSYTLNVVRLPSSNEGLASLTPGSGALSPVFNTSVNNYADTVGNSITSITVKPVAIDSTATVKVNGKQVASGFASSSIALAVGTNTINTTVTAQDSITSQNYILTVVRQPSSNAGLASLTPGSGTLSPAFNTAVANYADTVDNSITSITIKLVAIDSTATVTVNGSTLASGSISNSIALAVGDNQINTVVMAQDGATSQSYTLIVTRQKPALSTNASLVSLTPSIGTLAPVFKPGAFNYSDTVASAVTVMLVKPVASDTTASISVNGSLIGKSGISRAIPLIVGNNAITTVVTAQDGVTTQTYTLTVTKVKTVMPSNAYLASLIPGSGTLSPLFNPATHAYTDTVANTINTITFKPAASDTGATITVNGTPVNNNSISPPIAINVGNNTITTVVTAQDGITRQSYTVVINRQDPVIASAPVDPANEIVVHQAVSPNGDGINDYLRIERIENYPVNSVSIFTRTGLRIFNVKGYNNTTKIFDGHSNVNGSLQQPGTYFYTVEYTSNGQKRRKTGYFILKFN